MVNIFKRFLCVAISVGFTLSLHSMEEYQPLSKWQMAKAVISRLVRPLTSSISYVKGHAAPISFVASGVALMVVGYMSLKMRSLESALAASKKGLIDAEAALRQLRQENQAREARLSESDHMAAGLARLKQVVAGKDIALGRIEEEKNKEIELKNHELYAQRQRWSGLNLKVNSMRDILHEYVGLLVDVKAGERLPDSIDEENIVSRASASISKGEGDALREFLENKHREIEQKKEERIRRGIVLQLQLH
jgi:hypothetical protein